MSGIGRLGESTVHRQVHNGHTHAHKDRISTSWRIHERLVPAQPVQAGCLAWTSSL